MWYLRMIVEKLGAIMRKLSLLLCLLCVLVGSTMLFERKQPDAVPVPTAAAPTPAPERIVVEEITVQKSAAETALPEAPEKTAVLLQVYHAGEVTQRALEEYLIHVVAGEMPALYEEQALRAQAVAARSYIAWKMPAYGGGGCSRARGAGICTDSTHCMAYMSEEEMREDWGENYEAYRDKIASAVQDTAGQVLLYDGKPVQALFHASSGGRTEDAQAVWGAHLPYLTSVSSEEEGTERIRRMTKAELASALNRAFDGAGLTAENVQKRFIVRSATPGGRADSVRVGNVTATGRAVRSALNLSSTAFSVAYTEKEAVITTQGYGHGVGMSQEGANFMAAQGKTWQEILLHYYTGVTIGALDA